MLAARLAWRWMSALMLLVMDSRCCFARIVCISRIDARILFESWAVRRVKTPAALILFRTETSLLRPESPENESCSRLAIWVWILSAVPRMEPMVAIAFMFAPSTSWMDAYWDCTRPSSEASIPESSYGSYWDSGVVAFGNPVLMWGRPRFLMRLSQ